MHIGALSVLFPIIIGFYFFKDIGLNEKIILFLLVIAGLFDLFFYVTNESHINNISVFNVFTITEFVFLSIFYNFVFKVYLNDRYLSIIYGAILLIMILLSVFHSSFVSEIDSICISVLSITFIITSIVFIIKSNFLDKYSNEVEYSIKIINYTLLFYFSTTFIIYLLSDWVIVNHYAMFKYIWAINGLVSFLTNLLFTLALWKARYQTK